MSVPQVCTGLKKFEPLGKGCKIGVLEACSLKSHSRLYTRVACADFGRSRAVAPFIHSNCRMNQYIAIRNRVIGEVPKPTPQGLSELRETLRRVIERVPSAVPLTPEEFAECYTGRRRNRYLIGAQAYRAEGIRKSDAGIKMFVKDERIPFNPNKKQPDPRAIQFRGAKYCVAVGRYLKAIEHNIYELKGDGRVLPSTRVIGKGLSLGGRAMLARRKWRAFKRPVCVSLDAERFDKHCDEELLRVEHEFYTMLMNDREFAELLEMQLVNRGRTSEGLLYRARGKRMSGDMNTALGNCVLMILMVASFAAKFIKGHWDLLDDGDDCLLIIEEEDLEMVRREVRAYFLAFGHKIKVENIAHHFEHIIWCQSSPINYYGDGWKFVRNPWKVMMGALGGTKWTTMPRWLRASMINTIGSAELVLNLGVPVLQSFALALMRNSGTDTILDERYADVLSQRVKRELHSMQRSMLTRHEPQVITSEARLSFMKAFGVSIQEQIWIENWLADWTFSFSGDVVLPQDVDPIRWIRANGPYTEEHYHFWDDLQ